MIILQIAPVIGVGTGVGTVAYHLEQEWKRLGHDVRRLELGDTGGSWIPDSGPGLRGKLALMARVVWFSTVGTVVARSRIAEMPPDAVSICHNDALAGDIYVNHGVLQTSLAARGHRRLRMLRNPLHLFIAVRDTFRYRGGTHRVVVNLTSQDEKSLRQVYPRLRPTSWVIGNGVDVERFRPPSAKERDAERRKLGVGPDDVVTVFIGHEYERKGLYTLLEAVNRSGAHHHLVVVGGDRGMVEGLRRRAEALGCEDRCHPLGVTDPRPALWAGNLLAQPSAYESYGLVVTEAMASGVPVVSTPVGIAPDVILEGRTGYLTDGSVQNLAEILQAFEHADEGAMRDAARETAEDHAWRAIADAYLSCMRTMASTNVGRGRH